MSISDSRSPNAEATVGSRCFLRMASTILCFRIPVSQVRRLDLPEKPLPDKRGKQRFLDNILGERLVAQLQARDTQQVAALGLEIAGKVGAGHGGFERSRE